MTDGTSARLPTYRSLVRHALLTAGASLVAFGLAHVAFITWAVDRSEDTSLLGRLALMFGAPVGFGIPFAIVAALVGAAAWRVTRVNGTLASWRYGAALATSLLPAMTLSLAHGPYGDETPAPLAEITVLVSAVGLPAVIGLFAVGRRGLLMGLAALPLAAPWGMFLLAEGLAGWVIPFVASMVGILLAAGWLMERSAKPLQGEAASRSP